MVTRSEAGGLQGPPVFLVSLEGYFGHYVQDGDWLRKLVAADAGPDSIWLSEAERRKAEMYGLISKVTIMTQ